MAWDDPVVWIMIIGIVFLGVYGIFYVARLAYKANKVLDLQLKEQEKTKPKL